MTWMRGVPPSAGGLGYIGSTMMQLRVSGAQHSRTCHRFAITTVSSILTDPYPYSNIHHVTVSLGHEARFDRRGDTQVCRHAFSTRRSTSKYARKDGGASASRIRTASTDPASI